MDNTLLSLKTSAPGLPGPFLEENLASYARLEALEDARVKAVFVLGLEKKDDCLKKYRIQPKNSHSVDIHSANSHLLFFDAKIHLQPIGGIGRIAGGPTPVRVRHHHLMEHFKDPKSFGLELYSGVFFSICDAILAFIDDIDIEDFATMLSFWVASAKKDEYEQPNIVLVTARSTSDTYFEVVTAMQRSLQRHGVEQSSFSEVKKILLSTFQISIASHQSVTQSIEAIKRGNLAVKTPAMPFRASHLAEMIKLSIASFAQYWQPVSLVELSRQHYKVPSEVYFHIDKLISETSSEDKNIAMHVASALVVDAFPPGMHGKYNVVAIRNLAN